jgi:quercetin dioxygenase-like cupin family protein
MKAALALLVTLFPKPLQQLPDAFPRPGAKQLIDNERVTVWDVTVEKGKATPLHRHTLDFVLVDLSDATVKVISPNGRVGVNSATKGQVRFNPKGGAEAQEGVSDAPRHSIIVELKDVKVAPLPNKSGYPDAFPREGSKKVLDNPRVVVWDFSWTPGAATPMHFHDKDVVVVYLDNGDLSSTTPDGETTVNSYVFGQAKFNPRDRTHSELLLKGSQRVIAIELK